MREIVKVREDFELEGLEKYGFKYRADCNKWFFYDSWLEYIAIPAWNREISIESICGGAVTKFFDLVKDGVVVKEVVE